MGTGDGAVLAGVAFVAAGGYCLWRCLGTGPVPWRDRMDNGWHVLMCAAMAVMAFDAGGLSGRTVAGGTMALFLAGCGWFAVSATGVPLSARALFPWRAGPAAPTVGGCGDGTGARTRCLHHAVTMAAMVWMLDLMASGAPAGGHRSEADPMAGMPGMSGPAHPVLVGELLGAYGAVAAGALVVSAVRGRGRLRRDDGWHAVMTAAMAVAVWGM